VLRKTGGIEGRLVGTIYDILTYSRNIYIRNVLTYPRQSILVTKEGYEAAKWANCSQRVELPKLQGALNGTYTLYLVTIGVIHAVIYGAPRKGETGTVCRSGVAPYIHLQAQLWDFILIESVCGTKKIVGVTSF